jgi:hypothetical protein
VQRPECWCCRSWWWLQQLGWLQQVQSRLSLMRPWRFPASSMKGQAGLCDAGLGPDYCLVGGSHGGVRSSVTNHFPASSKKGQAGLWDTGLLKRYSSVGGVCVVSVQPCIQWVSCKQQVFTNDFGNRAGPVTTQSLDGDRSMVGTQQCNHVTSSSQVANAHLWLQGCFHHCFVLQCNGYGSPNHWG